MPFPKTQDIERDLLEMKEKNNNKQEGGIVELLLTAAMQAQSLEKGEKEKRHDQDNDHDNQFQKEAAAAVPVQANSRAPRRPPGGTPVWGAYAYWISKQGYEHVLSELQKDVGSLLWKGKRARYYCKS